MLIMPYSHDYRLGGPPKLYSIRDLVRTGDEARKSRAWQGLYFRMHRLQRFEAQEVLRVHARLRFRV